MKYRLAMRNPGDAIPDCATALRSLHPGYRPRRVTGGLEPATMKAGCGDWYSSLRRIAAIGLRHTCRLRMDDGVDTPGSETGETAGIYEGLRGLAPFGALTETELREIAAKMRRHRFANGDVIIRQGEPGEAFYLVTSGSVNVVRRGRAGAQEHHVTTLGPATSFGQRALIQDELRNASVVAAEEVEVYALAKTDFWKLLGQIPDFRGLIKRIDLKRK